MEQFNLEEVSDICEDIQEDMNDIMNKFYDRGITNVKMTVSFYRNSFGRKITYRLRISPGDRGGLKVTSYPEEHILTEDIAL